MIKRLRELPKPVTEERLPISRAAFKISESRKLRCKMIPKIDLASLLKEIDLRNLQSKSVESVRGTLKSLDSQVQSELVSWLRAVKSIKSDESLSSKEQEARVSELKTSEVVLSVLKSLLELLTQKIPLENKTLLKTGFVGLGMAASLLNVEVTGIALIVLHKALPKFVMSKKFDEFADFLSKELDPERQTGSGINS